MSHALGTVALACAGVVGLVAAFLCGLAGIDDYLPAHASRLCRLGFFGFILGGCIAFSFAGHR